MITLTQGNLLNSEAEALVNTVNCKGYMGKGIALQFRKAFPENFAAYQKACKQNRVVPGRMFVFEYDDMLNRKTIINFPTKRHWRQHSRMEDIESGLTSLVNEVQARNIRSIAIPPLGCGLGGLDWSEVKPRIEAAFAPLGNVKVFLYEPSETPLPKDQPVRTRRPRMTRARALLILLMHQYHQFDYRLTLLEIHKLAYLLQEQGEDMKLNFEALYYGPYASNLRFPLQAMEGHFILGLGDDENPDREVELMPGAVKEAQSFIGSDPDALSRLETVTQLINGYETPYGMELLTTVHWVNQHEGQLTPDDVLTRIKNWSRRKGQMFTPDHIKVALAHLGGNTNCTF
ncbi:macro domain-containing protein [Endozoicomonas atrinae]|uniref:type II toxin-antitoxin system antitoxin DNA ADP-ribosyl glycohydrolase DarG n=1 Tax=Endozoicomonas atrinae TaxID=1333660 RepID=UPI003AFFDC66